MPNTHDARSTYAATLAFVPERGELPFLLNARRLFGCGVEVGVKEGDFSEHLLRHWRGRHLISVDPWTEDAAEAYVDVANVPQAIHEGFHAKTTRRLSAFGDRSTVWRTTSTRAAERIPHHSLDFVYLDARHDHASVLEDLHAWFDRVRPGGILAGHDYVDGHFTAGVFGVKSAVDAFFAERGIPVHATLLDEPWLSWMVEVPVPGEEREHVEAAASAPAVTAEAAPASRPRLITMDFGGEGRRHVVRLALDPARMSQRMMLECLGREELYEPETTQFLVSVLRPGDAFVDVGTHVGYFSTLAAAVVGPGGKVVSFEPEAENFTRLLDNLRLNSFAHVEPVNMAVGEAEGEAEFFVNADNDGGHALWDVGLHAFNRLSREAPRAHRVKVTSLDAFLGARDLPPIRALKIDAEGAEQQVLRGAEALLRDRPIPFVVCEVNRFGLARMGASEAGLRAYMAGLGYETWVFLPGESSLVKLEPEHTVETDFVFNLLFRHPEAAAA